MHRFHIDSTGLHLAGRLPAVLALLLALLVPALGLQTGGTVHAANTPTVQIAPNVLLAGGSATTAVSGGGFTPSSVITLRLDNSATLGAVASDATGAFAATPVALPSLLVGQHTISATDPFNLSASQTLYVVSLSVSTSSTTGGTLVTVSGQGFLPSQPLSVSLGGQPLATNNVGTDASGAFNNLTFVVPASVSGPQALTIQSGTNPAISATTIVTFGQASLTLTPNAATVGSTFSVSGSGYPANAALTLMLDTLTLGTVTTSPSGGLGPVGFTVPSGIAIGSHTIAIVDGGGNTLATAVLSVTSGAGTLTISPASGAAGIQVTVTGNGFQAGETVSIAIGSATIATTTAGSLGQIAAAVTLPQNLPAGNVTLRATGQSSLNTATGTFLVSGASLTLSTASAAPGSQIIVVGHSFAPNEAIAITLGTAQAGTSTADAGGNFAAAVTVPAGQATGAVTITATGQSSHLSASATLTVTSAAKITLGAATVQPGGSIGLSGSGFGAGEAVTLSLPGYTLPAITADSQGNIAATLSIPTGATPASLTLTATGQQTGRSASTTLLITASAASLIPSSATAVIGGSLQVSGSGFLPGETVTIAAQGATLATVTAGTLGAFSNVAITLPTSIGAGTVTLTASGGTSHAVASAQLVVQTPSAPATITLSAGAVFAGGGFLVSGSGFMAGEQVAITVPGHTLATVQATTQGGFSNVPATLPADVAPGTLTVGATGLSSQKTATAALQVQAPPPSTAITLSAYYAGAGTSVQLSGSGFLPGEQISVAVPGYTLATVQANTQGGFSNLPLSLPAGLAPGLVTVSATGQSSQRTASASLQVVAQSTSSLSATPATVYAGGQLRVTGSGFAPGEQVALSINGGAPFATALTGGTGSFVITVNLPGTVSPGSLRLTATGLTSRITAATQVQVTSSVPSTAGSTTWYFAPGHTDAGFSEQIAMLNPNGRAVQGTITFYYGTDQITSYAFSLRARARSTFDVGQVLGGARVAELVTSTLPITVARTTHRGEEAVMLATGVPGPSRTWYMAEGYTGLTFQEELNLLNPGDQPAHVHIVWPLFNGRPPVVYDVTMAPRSIQDIPVNLYVYRASHATVVSADVPVVAARTILFGTRQQGADAKPGATSPSALQYFAEGSTNNGFEEYLTILNPSASQSTRVTATFFDRQGRVLGNRTIVVDAMHRGTIKVNDVARATAISTVLQSDLPVVAERAMYFGAPNGSSADGTVVFGQPAPALGWAFASGDTRPGHSEFELLFNPGGTAGTVQATYFEQNGQLVQRIFTLPASARRNIDVTLTIPELPRGYHGVILRSLNGVPFIAEQAIYFNNMANGDATTGTPLS